MTEIIHAAFLQGGFESYLLRVVRDSIAVAPTGRYMCFSLYAENNVRKYFVSEIRFNSPSENCNWPCLSCQILVWNSYNRN